MDFFRWMIQAEDMAGNHEERLVARYEEEFIVDTCAVTDSDMAFETGIKHPDYNDGGWIIVESYNTRDEAADGHGRWVRLILSNPPDELVETGGAFAGMMKGIVHPRTVQA